MTGKRSRGSRAAMADRSAPLRDDLGATLTGSDGVRFRVWAPRVSSLAVRILGPSAPRIVPLERDANGYFTGEVAGIGAGTRYLYQLDDGSERPDPVSRYQPDGVHGPSQVVDPAAFRWTDTGWQGMPLAAYVIYELHVGTFTGPGTFEAIIPQLDYLADLGVTALELMPVAQFPGEWNWGYDGVNPFAPQNSYGGPGGLKRLIDACHNRGLSVVLDVVYNHLGPEGNYLHGFGPYFTDRYRTPWGDAVNFDGPHSDHVRHYFISNALYWITEYHLDALRLDAVHGIYDAGARHILLELAGAVHRRAQELGRQVHVIAESDQNDVRLVTPPGRGGYGLDAQWSDDFHHVLRTFLTGDRDGYYQDFGSFSQLAKAFREGFVLSGDYSAFRERRHGSSSANIPPGKLVVFSQNHDQVGNRMRGERLGVHLSCSQLKLAAAAVLLSPYLPLLFMGEEYAEQAPFPYFVSHGDADLVAAVRRGRLEEFAAFATQGSPPDPQSESTFLSAKLNPGLRHGGDHREIFDFYRQLLRLRRECAPLSAHDRAGTRVLASDEEQVLLVSRSTEDAQVCCLFNFSDQTRNIRQLLPDGIWRILLDSTDIQRQGNLVALDATNAAAFPKLAPFGVIVYARE